jgi:hypothetical protein
MADLPYQINNLDGEIWKGISGYENLYQISNLGRIKSIRRNKILRHKFTTYGYPMICLSVNGIKEYLLIHRLLGFAFISNPNNLSEIDHIDRNVKNYNLSNLRWVTRSENIINTKIRTDNTTGHKNIYKTHDLNVKGYRVEIIRNNIKVVNKRCLTLEEAIEYRDNYLNNLIDE